MKLDYDRIKRELSIERVLAEYGMLHDLKRSGSRISGSCPIHGGDNPSAFNVSLEKNLWNCFTHCGGGTVIDLLMKIERVRPGEAAKLGYDMLGIEVMDGQVSSLSPEPLRFKLTLDPKHPYLEKRHIDIETARHFDVGYCDRGIMSGRIAIPIHNADGHLVAYCGRAVDDIKPKYRFPRGFAKNRVVYNLNRVKSKDDGEIVITEGFFDVFALYAAGIDARIGC